MATVGTQQHLPHQQHRHRQHPQHQHRQQSQLPQEEDTLRSHWFQVQDYKVALYSNQFAQEPDSNLLQAIYDRPPLPATVLKGSNPVIFSTIVSYLQGYNIFPIDKETAALAMLSREAFLRRLRWEAHRFKLMRLVYLTGDALLDLRDEEDEEKARAEQEVEALRAKEAFLQAQAQAQAQAPKDADASQQSTAVEQELSARKETQLDRKFELDAKYNLRSVELGYQYLRRRPSWQQISKITWPSCIAVL